MQPPVQVDQGLTDRGHAGDELLDLPGRRGRLGEHLPQVGDQAGVGLRREVLTRQVESFGEGEQYRNGDRALVVFQLVDVAGRQPQDAGQRHLGQPLFLAQSP